MNRVKSTNSIKVYEHDGKELPPKDDLWIAVVSHWNRNTMVVIDTGNHQYTIVASDLLAAIENARNTA